MKKQIVIYHGPNSLLPHQQQRAPSLHLSADKITLSPLFASRINDQPSETLTRSSARYSRVLASSSEKSPCKYVIGSLLCLF